MLHSRAQVHVDAAHKTAMALEPTSPVARLQVKIDIHRPVESSVARAGRGTRNCTRDCLDASTRKGPYRKRFEIVTCQSCRNSGIIVPYADILREHGDDDGATVPAEDGTFVENTVACPPPCPTTHQARIGSRGAE